METYQFMVTWPAIYGAICPTLRVPYNVILTMTGERQSDAFRRLVASINDTIGEGVQIPSITPWYGPIEMIG